VAGPITHVINIGKNYMIAHIFQTSFDKSWLPSLDELEVVYLYFGLIKKLCEVTTYPTEQQINEVLKKISEGEKNLLSFLEILYGKTKLQEIFRSN